MNMRKLYANQINDLDWEIEYNLARSEALGQLISWIMEDEQRMAVLGHTTEDEIHEAIVSGRIPMYNS